MKKPDRKPEVKLIGEDGNAWYIMGKVSKALRDAGADKEYVEEYIQKATSNDYNNLLIATMKYVDVL